MKKIKFLLIASAIGSAVAFGGCTTSSSDTSNKQEIVSDEEVPNFVGKDVSEAKKWFEDRGVKVDVYEANSYSIEKGKVTYTYPRAGQTINNEKNATIHVSVGKVAECKGTHIWWEHPANVSEFYSPKVNTTEKCLELKFSSISFDENIKLLDTVTATLGNKNTSANIEISNLNKSKYNNKDCYEIEGNKNYEAVIKVPISDMSNISNGISVKFDYYDEAGFYKKSSLHYIVNWGDDTITDFEDLDDSTLNAVWNALGNYEWELQIQYGNVSGRYNMKFGANNHFYGELKSGGYSESVEGTFYIKKNEILIFYDNGAIVYLDYYFDNGEVEFPEDSYHAL